MTTLTEASTIARIDRSEAFHLAKVEYDRYLEVLRSLDEVEWAQRTDCPDWDVRLMAAHVLGACAGCASLREQFSQVRRGKAWSTQHDRPEIDGINAVQVADRAHLAPRQICDELAAMIDKAVAGRKRVPGLARRIDVGDGSGGPMKLGWLMEVIYTRDTWMHRVDTLRAVGRLGDMLLTAEHDGRLVADVVGQWAAEHGQAFTLTLDGPAGGEFRHGTGGEALHLDAVEFMRVVSGRPPADGVPAAGLLAHTILF